MPTSSKSVQALRDSIGLPLWPEDIDAHPVPAPDKLCESFYRCASGGYLLNRFPVYIGLSMLIIVESGAVVIDSAQSSTAINAGDSALVAGGKEVSINEIPEPGCEVSYWAIFFTPRLIREVVGECHLTQDMAMRLASSPTTVYPLTNTLLALRCHRLPTPVDDIKKTFKILMAGMPASMFRFLHDQYYDQRALLQELARSGRPATIQIPGGTKGFRFLFKLYHGMEPATWLKRQKKSRRMAKVR